MWLNMVMNLNIHEFICYELKIYHLIFSKIWLRFSKSNSQQIYRSKRTTMLKSTVYQKVNVQVQLNFQYIFT